MTVEQDLGANPRLLGSSIIINIFSQKQWNQALNDFVPRHCVASLDQGNLLAVRRDNPAFWNDDTSIAIIIATAIATAG